MLQIICRYAKNVYLCNVFHGIRFKVNKGWDSAEPLFCIRTLAFLIVISNAFCYLFCIFALLFHPTYINFIDKITVNKYENTHRSSDS